MAEFQSFNPNPRATKVGDCAVRAVAKALGIDWYQSYVELASEGLTQCDMPSANNVGARCYGARIQAGRQSRRNARIATP